MPKQKRRLLGQGFAIGLEELEGLTFDINRPYVACLLCGAIFQSETDRKVPGGHLPNNSLIALRAKELRDNWSKAHARQKHTEKEHEDFRRSGLTMTPEAAYVLQAFGLLPVTDMAIENSETAIALLEAKAIPKDDAQS